ncbi:MAG TPA: carbohydrate-binding protein [Archangium sp.]|uniref:carbohydrate-binding protein n=1 Tax=Archangium sp. TaxID=1872627 RepID=UPI002ED7B1A7
MKGTLSGLVLVLVLAGVPATARESRASPAVTAGTDTFGVTMLYPTKAGGEEWRLADDARADPRFDPQNTLTRNRDGSWKIRSKQVRMQVFTSTGYDATAIPTYDREVLTGRGYMLAPNDWKNVEMTGYVRVNSGGKPDENLSWQARGGEHSDGKACEGSAYHGALHYDGRVRWQKESWHVSYDSSPYVAATTSLRGRWVGFKAIMRNVPTVEGGTAVQLELWLDTRADRVSWVKVYEMTDAGDWGGAASVCGGTVEAMPITWGGPIALFRWDGASDVDFKWLSVREID